MGQTFGHAWFSSYGAEPNSAWIDGLADMTVDDIKFGLGALKGWKSEFPPNMLQFRALCKPTLEDAHKIYRPSLPEPQEVRAKRLKCGLQAIASIKNSMAS